MSRPVDEATLRFRFYHNHLWARYKGAVFSAVYAMSGSLEIDATFVQIARTSSHRAVLGEVDLSYHDYSYTLLFDAAYGEIPRLRLVKALIGDLYKHRVDLVVLPGYHRIEYWAMLIVCLLAGRKRAVFVDSTAYDHQQRGWKEKAKAFFFRRCDGFLCYGARSREYIESYGIDERKIHDGCQAAALSHDYDAAAVRDFYAAHDTVAAAHPTFLYVGRLSQEKGLFDLLEALGRVRAVLPGARLDIVGSGPLRGELVERTEEFGLESAVTYLGTKTPEAIGALLMASSALILPSHREPWGLVVNEALSYGCPVVVSNGCGCLPELVHAGVTGYSFKARDVRALAAAMIDVARLSERRTAVAANCMDLMQQFTPERAAEAILGGCIYTAEH